MRNEIEIHFKGKNTQLVRAIEKLDKVTKSLINTQVGLDKSSRRTRSSQKKLTNSLDKNAKSTILNVKNNRLLSNSLATIRSKLLLVNFAFAMGVRQLMTFTRESAKLKSMEIAFTNLSGSTDLSSEALTKLREATRGAVSDFDLFQQANNAMILGVTKNADEMAELFFLAQKLGRALGKDTRASVESLITGLGRQSRLMLDNIGIVVKADEAYKRYAETLGTTADKLSDADKKQAFFNETLESARAKADALGDSTNVNQTEFEKLSAELKNIAGVIGTTLTPIFKGLSLGIRGTSVVVRSLLESFNSLFKAVGEGEPNIKGNRVQIELLEGTLKNLIKTGNLTEDGFGGFLGDDRFANEANRLAGEIKKLKLELESLTKLPPRPEVKFDAPDVDFLPNEPIDAMQFDFGDRFLDEIKSFQDEKHKIFTSVQEELIRVEKEIAQESLDATEKAEDERQRTFAESIKELLKMRQEEGEKSLSIAEQTENERQNLFKRVGEEINRLKETQDDEDFKRALEIEKARKLVLGDTIEFRIGKLTELGKKFRELGLNELEFTQFIEDEKKKIRDDAEEEENARQMRAVSQLQNSMNNSLSAVKDYHNKQVESELQSLKASQIYQMAGAEKREDLENEIIAKHSGRANKIFLADKALRISQIAMDTAQAMSATVLTPWVHPLIAGFGALQAGIVMAQKAPPQFEQGGLVGGRRHSQGGTMIEAERGEFVMSRSAVQAVGLETMNQINQGGVGGVTLNISAPLVDETVIDTIIPAIHKAQRMNLA